MDIKKKPPLHAALCIVQWRLIFWANCLVLVSQDWVLISLGFTIMAEIIYPGFRVWFSFSHHRFLRHRQDVGFFWSFVGLGFSSVLFVGFGFWSFKGCWLFWFYQDFWTLFDIYHIIQFLIQRCNITGCCTSALSPCFWDEVITTAIVYQPGKHRDTYDALVRKTTYNR